LDAVTATAAAAVDEVVISLLYLSMRRCSDETRAALVDRSPSTSSFLLLAGAELKLWCLSSSTEAPPTAPEHRKQNRQP